MSGSYLIAQTSKFLLIDAPAVTLGQGHGKVIWYISPDLYILCPKYLRFSSNSFDVIGKSHWGRRWGGRGRCGGNKLKTQSHPDLGDLTMIWCISEQFGVYHVMTLLWCFYPNKMSTILHCYVSASWLQSHILPCSSSRTLVSWKSRRLQGSCACTWIPVTIRIVNTEKHHCDSQKILIFGVEWIDQNINNRL